MLRMPRNWISSWMISPQRALVFWPQKHLPDWEGTVDAIVEPGKVWRVKYQATFWSARSHHFINFSPGDWGEIVGQKGLILLIESWEEESD